MAQIQELKKLPKAIEDELITQVLTGFLSTDKLVKWLDESHGIKVFRGATWRYSRKIHNKFDRLIKLGMPINDLVKNRQLIEIQGIEKVEQEIINRLDAKSAQLYAFLDEKV
jgi:hypothetical protein